MIVAGGVPATMPMRLPLQKRVGKRFHARELGIRLHDQSIGARVVGVGVLNQLVALRIADDDVACVGAERHPDEAGRHAGSRCRRPSSRAFPRGAPRSCSRSPPPLSLDIGHEVGVRADAQHFRIDELDRGAEPGRLGKGGARQRGERRQGDRWRMRSAVDVLAPLNARGTRLPPRPRAAACRRADPGDRAGARPAPGRADRCRCRRCST